MKAISPVKLLITVYFLLNSAIVVAQECSNPLGVDIYSDCDGEYPNDKEKQRQCSFAVSCLKRKNAQEEKQDRKEKELKQERKEKEEKEKQDKKEITNKCESYLKDYDEAAKKVGEECGHLNVQNNAECRTKAAACKKDLNSFGHEQPDSESAVGATIDILNVYAQIEGGGNGGVSPFCIIENDEKSAKEEERINDKITKLREEVAKLKEDAAKQDDELNKKRTEVEEKMNDLEKDFNEKKSSRQTKNQEAASKLQQSIFESEKTRKTNIIKINELQTQANMTAYDHQRIVLDLSDVNIQTVCKSSRDKALQEMLSARGTVGSNGKKTYTPTESQQIQKDVKLVESQCLQANALKRREDIEKVVIKRRNLQAQISDLEDSNKLEAQSIEQRKKDVETAAKQAEADEQTAIKEKSKALETLNRSVSDFEQVVQKKKYSLGEQADAKEKLINKLILDKQGVKSRYAKISSVANSEAAAASKYISNCCTQSDTKMNDASCGRVMKSEPDVKVKGAREQKITK